VSQATAGFRTLARPRSLCPLRRAKPPLACAGLGLLIALAYDRGAPNYDLTYALSWGAQLASGHRPSYDVPLPPTPHPLTNLFGLVLAPLGEHATDAASVVGLLVLGAVGYLAFVLGRELAGPLAGAVAAALALTRGPILFWGAQDYADIPACALLLAAIAFEIRRPRRAQAVLVSLLLAGLLRPEAWLLSGGYLLLMRRRAARMPDKRSIALGVAAPVIWVIVDWVTTGHPLYSFTVTTELTDTFGRATGPGALPVGVPRSIGQTMRPEVAAGAVLGLALTWRSNHPVAIRLLWLSAIATTATLAVIAAGTPLNDRYLFLAPVIGCVFCGAAVSQVLASDGRRRAAGALALLCVAVGVIFDVPRLANGRTLVREQRDVLASLHTVAERAATSGCPRVIAYSRAAPWLSVWAGTPAPRFIASGPEMPSAAVITPTVESAAQELVERNDDDLPGGPWEREPVTRAGPFWTFRVAC
jgi:hypothetical protein